VAARRRPWLEDVREMAASMAVAIADERPGTSLVSEPRTLTVGYTALGRTIAALVEAAILGVLADDKEGAVQVMQLISAMSLILREDGGSEEIALPQAGLARAARMLEIAADHVADGATTLLTNPLLDRDVLSATLQSDAMTLRGLIASYGADGGPTPLS
jgi:hypothetical protein